MSNIFAAQKYEQNMVHYLYVDVDGTETNSGEVSIGFLPGGSVVTAAYLVGSQAVTPSAARYTIGFRNRRDNVADDTDGIATAIIPVLGRSASTLVATANLTFSDSGEVTLTRSTNADVTAGRFRVVVEYTVDNNRP